MSWLRILAWIAGLSAVTILFVWFSIKISYMQHLNQLNACLQELEEEAA